jgi:AraC-like DNA-binding protein
LTWEPPELTVRVSYAMTASACAKRRASAVQHRRHDLPHALPLIRASVLAELRDYVARSGQLIEPLLDEAGIDRACLDDPLASAPLNGVIELFDSAAKVMGDPCLGLHFAESFHPRGAGLLGHLSMSAPTVREALACAARCVNVYATKVTARFEERGGVGYLTWTLPPAVTATRIQYSTFAAAALVHGLRAAAGPDWRPLSVEFDHRELPCAEEARKTFGERVRFSQPANVLVIDKLCLAKPMPTADPALHAILADLAERWLAELADEPEVAETVTDEIVTRLRNGTADLEHVADGVGLSPRALQWRLEQSGTSFEKLLNQTRAHIAEHLLRDTDRPLTEIAFDLGFSDPSAFTRAARRWFNMAPRVYRQMQRRGEIPPP